ncbi:MAG: hypothetical protein WC943_01900 [Elusimicrobiota bacterium]|jgi:hypothetical protein
MTRKDEKKQPAKASQSARGGKKKYNKPELEKHGVLSIVEGD